MAQTERHDDDVPGVGCDIDEAQLLALLLLAGLGAGRVEDILGELEVGLPFVRKPKQSATLCANVQAHRRLCRHNGGPRLAQ